MARRIVCTTGTCAGAPRFEATRVTVFNVVRYVTDESLADFLEDYPDFDATDVRLAAEYCSARRCEEAKPDHFCDGCTLRRLDDGLTFEDFLRSYGSVQAKSDTTQGEPESGDLTYLGGEDELRKQWEGRDGWALATKLLERDFDG